MTVSTSIDYSMDVDFDAVLRRRTTFSRLMRPDVTADEPFLSMLYVSTEKSDRREKSNEQDVFRDVYIDVKARSAYFGAKCQDRDLPEANYHDHVKFQAGDRYQRHLTTKPIVARGLRACRGGSEHTSTVLTEEPAKKAASVTVQTDKPQDQHQFSSPADIVHAQLFLVEDPYDPVLLSLSEAFAKGCPSTDEFISLSKAFVTESPSIDEPPLVSAVVLDVECAVPAHVVAAGCSLGSLVRVSATKIEVEDIRAVPVEVKEAQPSSVNSSGCSPLVEVFEGVNYCASLLISTLGDSFKNEQPLSESVQWSVEKGASGATATQGCSLIEAIESANEETGLLANGIADVLFPFERNLSPRRTSRAPSNGWRSQTEEVTA